METRPPSVTSGTRPQFKASGGGGGGGSRNIRGRTEHIREHPEGSTGALVTLMAAKGGQLYEVRGRKTVSRYEAVGSRGTWGVGQGRQDRERRGRRWRPAGVDAFLNRQSNNGRVGG